MHDDLWKLDAVAQAALVRSRAVTRLELLDAAISRIELLNPQLNALISPLYDRARILATKVDRDAPFAGVPMLLKDACQQKHTEIHAVILAKTLSPEEHRVNRADAVNHHRRQKIISARKTVHKIRLIQ